MRNFLTRSRQLERLFRLGIVCLGFVLTLPPVHAGTRASSIQFDGRTRSYLVHVPPSYDGKKPLPLVLVLHGGTQSAESAERMSGMSELADRENFLAVYPTGTSRFGRAPTWNAGNCCGYALKNHVDDVAFFRALLKRLKSDYHLDPNRIFVTGISNGAMMSYRLACEMADQIAAIAPVEGTQNVSCKPSSPVSLIVFHGTADRLVPLEGGTSPLQVGPRRYDTPVASSVTFWAKQDGCESKPRREKTVDLRTEQYSGCKQGAAVSLYVIEGGHHMWPGLRISGNHVPASEIMWKFFAEHPKQVGIASN